MTDLPAYVVCGCLVAICAYGWYFNARGWRLAREWSDIQALHLNGFALELGIDHAGAVRPARAAAPVGAPPPKAAPRIIEPPPLPTVAVTANTGVFPLTRRADDYPADVLRSRKTHGFFRVRYKLDDEISRPRPT